MLFFNRTSFNSTLVQLKVLRSSICFEITPSFNSTLVQLKATKNARSIWKKEGFNSTLVQLKVDAVIDSMTDFAKFQFYLSSIKRYHNVPKMYISA